jgi:hypothetical protein
MQLLAALAKKGIADYPTGIGRVENPVNFELLRQGTFAWLRRKALGSKGANAAVTSL